MAQPPIWTMDNYKAYTERRDTLKDNYTNNLNIVKQRTIPAALDYPGAAQEVENAKSNIQSTIHSISAESETLTAFLKQLQNQMGPEMVRKITQDEKKLKKIIDENNIMEKAAALRKEQANNQETKYDSNLHSSIFSYMPWEIETSKWFIFSPTNPYIDLNPGARSILLFIACIFGISSLIVLGVFVIDFIRTKNINFTGFINKPGFTNPMIPVNPKPIPIQKTGPILPIPVIKRAK